MLLSYRTRQGQISGQRLVLAVWGLFALVAIVVSCCDIRWACGDGEEKGAAAAAAAETENTKVKDKVEHEEKNTKIILYDLKAPSHGELG